MFYVGFDSKIEAFSYFSGIIIIDHVQPFSLNQFKHKPPIP